jgi:hypothetical protein
MDEHKDHPPPIPLSKPDDGRKPSESAPILAMNASSSSIDMSSKISLPDTMGGHKAKNRSHEKSSHKDFPEIRAYYAK